jgi:hypothetical protein
MSETGTPFSALESSGKFYERPKFWLAAFLLAASVILFLLFYKNVVRETWSDAEVSRSIQVTWHDTIWMDKKGLHGEVVIVPAITFRIRNNGDRPLTYVCFDGEFAYQETKEKMWSGYVEVLKEQPLAPGQESADILMKSWHGYTATSKKAFFDNIKEWKRIEVILFAKTQGSGYVKIGSFPIKQAIQGVQVIETPAPLAEAPTR